MEPEQAKMELMEINTDKDGMIVPLGMQQMEQYAELLIRSEQLPKRYNKKSQVMVAMQYARELNIAPLIALKQIAVIQGTPSIYGDLPLSVVRNSGKLEYIKEFLFDSKGKVISWENQNLNEQATGAVCITKRKDQDDPRETFFTIKMAQQANIFRNVWATFPNVMLKYRARSENLKDNFGDVLNGISIGEYDHNITNPETDTPTNFGETDQASTSTTNDLLANAVDIPEQSKVEIIEDVQFTPVEKTAGQLAEEKRIADEEETAKLLRSLAAQKYAKKQKEKTEKLEEIHGTPGDYMISIGVDRGKRIGLLADEDVEIKRRKSLDLITKDKNEGNTTDQSVLDLYDAILKYQQWKAQGKSL